MGNSKSTQNVKRSSAEVALEDRKKACLIGLHVGDCIGLAFKYSKKDFASMPHVNATLKMIFEEKKILPYSGDTALTRSSAKSLIKCGGLKPHDMAEEFLLAYYKDPDRSRRNYGVHVQNILQSWRNSQLADDLFEPAQKSFDGMGSYGNRGAARLAAVPIYFFDNVPEMLHVGRIVTQFTHNHVAGVNGALLFIYSIHLALKIGNSNAFDPIEYLDQLIVFCQTKLPEESGPQPLYYRKKLHLAKELLKIDNPSREEVVANLGRSFKALESVVTAIYCALRGRKPIEGLQNKSSFERTVVYAVSLAGDCHCVPMAGAISGALHGQKCIPADWKNFCEGMRETERLAEELISAPKCPKTLLEGNEEI